MSLLLSIAFIALSFGFKKLSPWARIAGTVLSSLGLLAFPVGTLINVYILYLLLCEKGKMVFSGEYKTIIQQTPHLKSKTSIIVWALLGILLVLLLVGLASLAFIG